MGEETIFHDGFYFSSSASDSEQSDEEERPRAIWFADEDKTTKRSISELHLFYYTSDGLPPQEDGGNILYGHEAKQASRKERRAKNLLETNDITSRLFNMSVKEGGCGRSWENLEKKILELEEPSWSFIGLLWRRLYGKRKRIEEREIEAEEGKARFETYMSLYKKKEKSATTLQSFHRRYLGRRVYLVKLQAHNIQKEKKFSMCRVQKVEGEESFEIDLVIVGKKFTTKIQSEGDISNMVVNFIKENPECEKHSGKIQMAFQEVLSKYGKKRKATKVKWDVEIWENESWAKKKAIWCTFHNDILSKSPPIEEESSGVTGGETENDRYTGTYNEEVIATIVLDTSHIGEVKYIGVRRDHQNLRVQNCNDNTQGNIQIYKKILGNQEKTQKSPKHQSKMNYLFI
jgi:hypothetical protein